MGEKKWILGLIILIAAVAAISIWGFKKTDSKDSSNVEKNISGEQSVGENYFSEDAAVMYFYSDYCSWCLKEKEVLQKLGTEGYRVKSMNVGDNPAYWTDYKINGTPTFIAKNGDRIEGYRDYEVLKPWLNSHK
jgi:protein-disulfide isomerase